LTFKGVSHKILSPKGVYMDVEKFSRLEEKVDDLLSAYTLLKQENKRLQEENRRLVDERSSVKYRIDAILEKLEGIEKR
jgi:FtsZ-binding cell division protein ZapB